MKRVVIANFYPVWPAVGGGQRRIYYLARELSKAFDVELIVPNRNGLNETAIFNPRLREFRVKVEPNFYKLEAAIDDRVKMASDVAYAEHWDECTLYNEVLAKRVQRADIAVTAHPYSIYSLLQARGDKDIPIVFDSQNVELRQKTSVLEDLPDLLESVRKVEETALLQSQGVIACTPNDAETFEEEYGIDAKSVTIIENGVDALGIPDVPEDALSDLRARLGLTNRLSAIFGGSFHHPNFSAAERVMKLAEKIPQMHFIILGGVCNYPGLKRASLENLTLLGEVDESTKWMAFRIADIALNPMDVGSGSNIKMFEYAAAQLAIISTPFGARGIGLEEGKDFIKCGLDGLDDDLKVLSVADRPRLQEIGAAAREVMTQMADWSIIGKRYIEFFRKISCADL